MSDFIFNIVKMCIKLSLESFTDNSIEVSWSTNIDGSTKLVYE